MPRTTIIIITTIITTTAIPILKMIVMMMMMMMMIIIIIIIHITLFYPIIASGTAQQMFVGFLSVTGFRQIRFPINIIERTFKVCNRR